MVVADAKSWTKDPQLTKLVDLRTERLQVTAKGEKVQIEFLTRAAPLYQLYVAFNAVFHDDGGDIVGGCRHDKSVSDGVAISFTCFAPDEADLTRTEIHTHLRIGD